MVLVLNLKHFFDSPLVAFRTEVLIFKFLILLSEDQAACFRTSSERSSSVAGQGASADGISSAQV
jgi:hypothetical protein